MYRGFAFRSTHSSTRRCIINKFAAAASSSAAVTLAVVPTTTESISTFFAFESTKPLLAFEPRSTPKPVVRTASASANANANINSVNKPTDSPSASATTAASNQLPPPETASQKYPEAVKEWKRIVAEAEKAPSLHLRQEFLKSLDDEEYFSSTGEEVDERQEPRGQGKSIIFDSPFVQALLYAAAAVLPLPFVSSSPSAFSKQCDTVIVHSSPSTSISSPTTAAPSLPPLVARAIHWIVQRRQQAQAQENAALSLDAAIAHYCLVRLGFFFASPSSSSPSSLFASIYHQNQKQHYTYSQNQTSSSSSSSSSSSLMLTSVTASETARRLALNQRELRNLTTEALTLASFTSGYIGKTATAAGDACLLKLTPLLQQQAQPQHSLTFQQLSLIAAFVFDPANFSSASDRAAVALRKALSMKILPPSASSFSIHNSSTTTTSSSSSSSSTINIDHIAGTQSAVLASLIASLLRDPCLSEPDVAATLLQQYCDLFLENVNIVASPRSALELVRSVCENVIEKSSASDLIPGQFVKKIPAVRRSVAKFCEKLTAKQLEEDLFCTVELFQYLTLPSLQKSVPELDGARSKIVNFVETKVVLDGERNSLTSVLEASGSRSGNAVAVDEAWMLADSLLSGLSRQQNPSFVTKLSHAYLKNLLSTPPHELFSGSYNNTKTAKKIAALLKAPNMIQNVDLQKLITTVASAHSAPLRDILIVLEGMTSSPFARNSHEARQLARSIAPTTQLTSLFNNQNSIAATHDSNSESPNKSDSSSSLPSSSSATSFQQSRTLTTTTTSISATSNTFASPSSPKEELIRVAHCYGVLRVREESLCQVMIGRAIHLRDELSADELGAFVFALARMDERNPKPYVDLAQRVRAVTSTASAAGATAIIVAYARAAAVWNYTMYFRLCERIVDLKATWKRRDMLPLLVALLRLELRHEKIFSLVTLEVLRADADQLTTEECVRFLSILTQFTPNTPVVPKLGEIFVQRQNELTSVQLGEVLSSLGRAYAGLSTMIADEVANSKNPAARDSAASLSSAKIEEERNAVRCIFDKLVLRATNIAPSAPPVAIASILNGFASLSYPHKEIFSVLAERILQIRNECPALVIGQALHSFASVGLRDDKLFVEMIPRVRFVAHHGSPQDVANVLTAYTTVQLWHYKLFVRLAERAIAVRSDCRPHQIAQILAAFAKVDMKYDKLFIELSPRIQAVSGSASASDVASIASSYAQMNLYDAPVFSQLADRAVQIGSQFSGEEALTMISSFDKLSVQHEALRKVLGRKADDEKAAKKKKQDEDAKNVTESSSSIGSTSSSSCDANEEVELEGGQREALLAEGDVEAEEGEADEFQQQQ